MCWTAVTSRNAATMKNSWLAPAGMPNSFICRQPAISNQIQHHESASGFERLDRPDELVQASQKPQRRGRHTLDRVRRAHDSEPRCTTEPKVRCEVARICLISPRQIVVDRGRSDEKRAFAPSPQ